MNGGREQAEAAERQAETARDADLVRRLQKGDSRALEELFRRHRDAAYAIAYRLLGNADDALDVVQESFIHVLRGIAGFRGQSSFRTWLYRIVTHAALDYRRYRALRSSASLESESSPEPAAVGDRRRSPPDETAAADLRDAIDKALMNVSEKNRVALVLYAMEGMSYKEIGEVLGISVGTVMSRIFNARQRLRELLAPEIG
ncbi:MAG: sigma-70 family RNA polymerase sigma factor [Phycisphaerae bacterium]|nr:sigma-70 family RNA polymerase sigma factor [Phycisphaerae bacterium]